MDKDAYIKHLEEENARLKKRIEELERLLGMNSKNSSKPPSSDPPGISAVLPKPRRKKRGAKNGHQPYLRRLLPQEMVKQHFELKPQACPCGSTNLEKTNEEPLRHQIVDIPPIEPEVAEYTQPIYRCKDCGRLIYQPLPDEIRRRYFGSGVLAVVGMLTGVLNTSKRKALAVINEVFSVPMSLGGLSNSEGQVTARTGHLMKRSSMSEGKMLHMPMRPAGQEVTESEVGCGVCVVPVQQLLWLMPSEDKKRLKSCWADFAAHWSVTAGADITSFAALARYAGRI